MKQFIQKFSDDFESIERKSFYSGLLEGLKEAKRYLEFVASINSKSPDCACLKADAENKLDDINESIDNAKLESMK